MSMSAEEKVIVERAWNDLLTQNPTDGFTRKQLLEHLKSSYGLDIKPGKLQAYLQDAYTATTKPKLAILPYSSPYRYIKGEAEMTTKDPSQLEGGGVGGNGLKDLLKDKDKIGILNIYRGMLTFHGFESNAKANGCDFRFKTDDLESEAANQPEKFTERFAKFEAAMEECGLKELFDACSELRNLVKGKFRSLVRGNGKEKAEALRTMITDKMEDFRKAQGPGREKVMALLADLRQTVAEDERKQQEKKRPPAAPNLDELDQFLGQPAAGGQAEATPANPAATDEGKTEPVVKDQPEPQPQPTDGTGPGTGNPPGPTSTDPPSADNPAENENAKDLQVVEEQLREANQELAQEKKRSEAAEGERERVQQTLNGLIEKIDQAGSSDAVVAIRQQCEALQAALVGSDGTPEKILAAIHKLEAKIDALTTVVSPITAPPAPAPAPTPADPPPVVPPSRWAQVKCLARRAKDNKYVRYIICVLIALVVVTATAMWIPKDWEFYTKAVKPKNAPQDAPETQSERIEHLRRQIDDDLLAIDPRAAEKGDTL